MKLVYLPSTIADLEWMRTYNTRVFPSGLQKAQVQFRATEKLLLDHPHIGKVTDYPDTYELVITRTPFSIIYRLSDDQIQILRIWDNRADRTNLMR